MSHIGRRAALHRFPLVLTTLAALLWLPSLVFGQPEVAHTPKIIEIKILPNDVAAVKDVDLRPNTPTEFGFDVKNLAGVILGDVNLKVVQVVKGQPRLIAEATIPKLEQTPPNKEGFQVLKFDKVKVDGDKPKAVPENLVLEGPPPFKLQVHVQHKILKPPVIREFKLVVAEPRGYVNPTAEYFPANDLLEVVVGPEGTKTFLGPHLVPLKLELSAEVTAKSGSDKAELTPDGKKVRVDAGDLTFERALNEGDVHLTVDGYERAFTYRVKPNVSGKINPRKASDIRVRIAVPRYAAPDANFKVPLEIDGPLTDDYKVQVSLDGVAGIKEFHGLREQKVTLSVSPAGKLICKADVSDRQIPFNTSGIKGRNVKFRVSVLKEGEKVDLTYPPEFRPFRAKTEDDKKTKEIFSVFALVTVDNSEPEVLPLELPKDKVWGVGTPPLEVRARVKERKPTQAPISEAILIRGKLPKDDKQVPEILAKGEFDPKQNDWKFTLPPQSKPETLEFSVQFKTVTGAKAAVTENLTFKEGLVGKKSYTIKGRVREGLRPQPGADVLLLDAKGKEEKGKAKTNPKGEFVFENVEPGTYMVRSTEASGKRTANETVVVPVKDNKEVILDLFAK